MPKNSTTTNKPAARKSMTAAERKTADEMQAPSPVPGADKRAAAAKKIVDARKTADVKPAVPEPIPTPAAPVPLQAATEATRRVKWVGAEGRDAWGYTLGSGAATIDYVIMTEYGTPGADGTLPVFSERAVTLRASDLHKSDPGKWGFRGASGPHFQSMRLRGVIERWGGGFRMTRGNDNAGYELAVRAGVIVEPVKPAAAGKKGKK